jgi:hypothetical protein
MFTSLFSGMTPIRIGIASLLLVTAPVISLNSPLPPKPSLTSIPFPAKLAGGLFLFQTSVKKRDKDLCQEILSKSQEILRRDPLISMELGPGLEAGGVFSSSSSIENNVHQLVMEFQINGGNSWAQCRCHGLKYIDGGGIGDSTSGNEVEMISLSVSNMDAAFNGGWAEVTLPQANSRQNEEDGEYKLPYIE